MLLLDSPTKKLQVVLAAAKTTLDAIWDVTYEDTPTNLNSTSGPSSQFGNLTGVTNGTTVVDMVPAPAAGWVRKIHSIRLNNADTGSITPSIVVNDNGTSRVVWKSSRATLEQLNYAAGSGFQAYAATGAKQ